MLINDDLRYQDYNKTAKQLSTTTRSYDPNVDGPFINPTLKILGNKANNLSNGRWEIFTLLLDENGNLGMRTGIKLLPEHIIYDDLDILIQFENSHKLPNKYKKMLTNYKWGHPSLAISTDQQALKHSAKNEFTLLPVYLGGYLKRNDKHGKPTIQILLSSGRYPSVKYSSEQLLFLYRVIAFFIQFEYGNNYSVEIYEHEQLRCVKEKLFEEPRIKFLITEVKVVPLKIFNATVMQKKCIETKDQSKAIKNDPSERRRITNFIYQAKVAQKNDRQKTRQKLKELKFLDIPISVLLIDQSLALLTGVILSVIVMYTFHNIISENNNTNSTRLRM